MQAFLGIVLIQLVILLSACGNDNVNRNNISQSEPHTGKDSLMNESSETQDSITNMLRIKKDTLLYVPFYDNQITFHVRVPEGLIVGQMLLLHGWNLPTLDWCNKMTFCEKALAMGYMLIMPEFGKSTYQWENYPQTNKLFYQFPTREWMYDKALPALQQMGLLVHAGDNFVAGISTGARGAAFFALEHPEIFKACAALSGDFDQTRLKPGEWINTNVYGPLEDFPERWSGKDNIYNRAEEYRVPTIFGHGTLDDICNVKHSVEFHRRLQALHPNLEMMINTPEAAHDYAFWDSQTEAILQFFDRFKNEKK